MKVEKQSVLTKTDRMIYSCLLGIGSGVTTAFAVWWFGSQHIPHNFIGVNHIFDFLLFVLLSYVLWSQIIQEVFNWYIASFMKKALYRSPEKGLSVAFLTAFVPHKESYEVLERNLKAMAKVDYPHDTWLLDEGNDIIAKKMCEKYQVKHFSRFGIEKYNTPEGPYKTKTKGGNYNAWFDQYGVNYHMVAQVDVDFAPNRNFLNETLGYFKDPDVAFVGSPQFYGNKKASWIAQGASEQSFNFYGPTQMGLNNFDMSLFIGANHVLRSIAHHDIEGYAGHIVEDHLTGMHVYKNKWKSVYVAKILAVGEGPSTWVSYFGQQMRWSYGLIHILLNHSPRIYLKLRLSHLFNYLVIQQYYFYGLAQAIGVLLLSLYFIFGITSTQMKLAPLLILYISTLLMQLIIGLWLRKFYVGSSNKSGYQLRGRLLSVAVWPIYFLAFLCIITGKKLVYRVTPKGKKTFTLTNLSIFVPHIILGTVTAIDIIFSFYTHHQAVHLLFFAVLNTIFMFSFPAEAFIKNMAYRVKSIDFKDVKNFGVFRFNLLINWTTRWKNGDGV